MYLIDTNVISESRKRSKADSGVRGFFRRVAKTDIARRCGRLRVPHPENVLDKKVAATALIYDLTVVKRNHKDFSKTDVRLLNPFKQCPMFRAEHRSSHPRRPTTAQARAVVFRSFQVTVATAFA